MECFLWILNNFFNYQIILLCLQAELNKSLEAADIQHMHFIEEGEVEHVDEEDLFEAVDDRVFEEESREEIVDDDEHPTVIEFKQVGPEIKKVILIMIFNFQTK